jgi:hypothetical protein
MAVSELDVEAALAIDLVFSVAVLCLVVLGFTIIHPPLKGLGVATM